MEKKKLKDEGRELPGPDYRKRGVLFWRILFDELFFSFLSFLSLS